MSSVALNRNRALATARRQTLAVCNSYDMRLYARSARHNGPTSEHRHLIRNPGTLTNVSPGRTPSVGVLRKMSGSIHSVRMVAGIEVRRQRRTSPGPRYRRRPRADPT